MEQFYGTYQSTFGNGTGRLPLLVIPIHEFNGGFSRSCENLCFFKAMNAWISRLPKISVLLIGGLSLWITANLHWGKEHWHSVLQADANGYFAYLPAVFIYQDLTYGFYDQIEHDTYKELHQGIDYREDVNHRKVNKFYCGTPLFWTPFYAIAHWHTKATGLPIDGYSKWYRLWITIASVFYLTLGLWWLNLWLRETGLKPWPRVVSIWAGFFGTHLFYYTVGEPGLSHVYSFSMMALFAWQAHRYFQQPHGKHLPWLAISLAFLILLRPVNGLALFATPLLAGSWRQWVRGMKSLLHFPTSLVLSLVGGLLLLSIQLLIYKISVGQWLVYSYTEEGFNFDAPQIFNFLFSYKKGFLLYTPLAVFALSGLVGWWKTQRFRFWSWLGFFALVVYVLSSWWNWWYGGSFSQRPMVEYLPFFILLLAHSWQSLQHHWQRLGWMVACVLLVGFTQFQTIQYRYYLIHWEAMDAEKYWEVFGQLP
ncbi:MAG: hypothetical protein ACFB10_23695 [Salibacteraceae bacterium]